MNGGTYKTGTYKGLDMAIGKGEKAVGGILIRGLMQVEVIENQVKADSDIKKDLYTDGPCNSVNKMLSFLKPDSFAGAFDIKDLVQ